MAAVAEEEKKVVAEVEEDEDEVEAGAGTDEASKKKKKKKKKKAGDDAEPALAEAEAETSAPKPAAAKAKAKAAGGDDDDDEDDDPEDAGKAGGKKKKRGKKKKADGFARAMGSGGAHEVAKYCPDDEFQAWAEAAMKATENDSTGMSKEDQVKMPVDFNGFTFIGSLRPAFVTRQMRMPADIMFPDYANDEGGVSMCERQGPKEVPILEGEKLATMREACRYGREVLDIAARYMRAGTTGDEIDRVVYQACVDRKIYPSPMNYYRFPKSVCVSPNEVICHGIPDRRPIEEGDVVNLDVSIYYKGFHSDLNETFFIGECDEESKRLVATAYNCLYAAASQIKPGTFYRDLGNVIHKEAVKNACSVVTTYCGHGVGELFHGPPKVPHYQKSKAVGIMKPGHVFTVEPMINVGGNGGDRTWPDNWTAVTKDGKRSAQFEHTFLVTETGVEVMTGRPGIDQKMMPLFNPAMFQR